MSQRMLELLDNIEGALVPDSDDDVTVGSLTADSLSTGGVNNTVYASEQSGSTGGEQIQNAIDAANATAGTNVVVVEGLGPDDVSNSSGAIDDPVLAQNAWEIPTHISVPSNTLLSIQSCYWFLSDGADDNLIRNSGIGSGGNQYIAIEGENAILDGNGVNQTTFDRETGPAVQNLGVRLTNVDQCRVTGLTMRNVNCWAIRAEDIRNSHFSELTFQQLDPLEQVDGIDLIGPATNVVMDGLTGLTDDDLAGVKCDDPDKGILDGEGGDVRGVSVSNITHESTAGGAHGLRILRGDDANTIEWVVVDNVTSRGGNGAVEIGFGESTGLKDDCQHIALSNIQSYQAEAVHINEDCRRVVMSNIQADVGHAIRISASTDNIVANTINSNGIGEAVRFDLNGELFGGSFTDITYQDSGQAFQMLDNTTADGLYISGVTGYNPTGAVIDIDAGCSITNGKITDVNVRDVNALLAIEGTFDGTISDMDAKTVNNALYPALNGNIVFGPNMPAFDSAPPNTLHSLARASPSWDPDGDGNGEWVVSDGNAWQEVVDLPNWT